MCGSVCVLKLCVFVCVDISVVSYYLQESLQVVCCLHRWVQTAVVPRWIWSNFNTFISVAATGDFDIDYCETKNQLKEHDH